MNRREFLLASSIAAIAGCGRRPVPFGGSPQAPNTDAQRIREDQEWRALYPRDRGRDWVDPGAARTVPAAPSKLEAAVSELGEQARQAVLLHPRFSEEPAQDGSKLGGTFLWPANEDWPMCADHPSLRLAPLLQLRADEFPEIEFRSGTDLLQVLWCPREHDRCWAKPVLVWRKSFSSKEALTAMPADAGAYPRYVPLPCRLFPERVTDLPDRDQVDALLKRLDDGKARTRELPELADLYGEYFPRGGFKIGGYANWIQGPETPRCRAGHTMELFLTCASEFMNPSQAPVQEAHLYANPARRDMAAMENAANAPRLRSMGDGYQFSFICRQCEQWPIETISQC